MIITSHRQPWASWKAFRGDCLAWHFNVLIFPLCRETSISRKQIPVGEESKDRSKYKSNKRYPGDRSYLQSSQCKACIMLLSLRHFLLPTLLLILSLSYEKNVIKTVQQLKNYSNFPKAIIFGGCKCGCLAFYTGIASSPPCVIPWLSTFSGAHEKILIHCFIIQAQILLHNQNNVIQHNKKLNLE